MVIASRTPEGDAFSCEACGTVDRIEPSVGTGDAVCPRCGGYLLSVLAAFDNLFGGPEPVTLDTDIESFTGGDYDATDVAERVEELGHELGVNVPWDEFERCRTVADLVRLVASLHGRR